MPVHRFPDPADATPDGIVAWGGDLHPDTLRLAYRQGIFPWPHDGYPLLWFSPPERAVLEFDRLHIPRRLARVQRSSPLRFTIDTAFEEVITACRESRRPGQPGTWITPAIQSAYVRLHREGNAHSIEAWDAAGNLAGGLYGVDAGGVFCGESMFYRVPNASKLALLHLARHLQEQGSGWMDIQMMTPHMAALGAVLIPRDRFLKRLREEQQAHGLSLFPARPAASP